MILKVIMAKAGKGKSKELLSELKLSNDKTLMH